MIYPPAPWQMHGSMWLTVFRLSRTADEQHPPGMYGAALVNYEEPSPLTYHELLLARPTRSRHNDKVVTITDIWVDSAASRAGGRELWAIPKQICSFDHDTTVRGPLTSAAWSTRDEHGAILEASFTDIARAAPRVPFTGLVEQPGIEEHPDFADVTMSGNAKALPCRARWRFAEDGPLGFLAGARQLGSFRMAGFRLRFD